MKILLIGSNGQLGTDLLADLQVAGHSVTPATRATLDICDPENTRTALEKSAPDLVINTAAFHNVELCETEAEQAFQVNAFAIRNLALSCKLQGCELMHFSTDFVFGGKSREPYKETDLPDPVNVYGASKVAGEHLVALTLERNYVVRTCGLYGTAGSRSRYGNFVEKILKRAIAGEPVRVVDDQVLTPTSTRDVARAVNELIQTKKYGLYQITNEGECSWYEFARKALVLSGVKAHIEPQSSSNAKVTRPRYSALSKEKLYSVGVSRMPQWQDALTRYMAARSQPQTTQAGN